MNSQLILNQILGDITLKTHFENFFIDQIPRNENSHADALATLGSTVEVKADIPVLYLSKSKALNDSSIDLVLAVESRMTWKMLINLH